MLMVRLESFISLLCLCQTQHLQLTLALCFRLEKLVDGSELAWIDQACLMSSQKNTRLISKLIEMRKINQAAGEGEK